MDFQAARTKMVDNQIRTTDVTSHSVLSAFLSVPREAFVPERKKALAYIDTDIALSDAEGGRYLMEPSPLAKLLQFAENRQKRQRTRDRQRNGYGAALLAHIATQVVALESDDALAATAKDTLASLGLSTVTVVTGPLEAGCPKLAPFDVIFIHGAVETVPSALCLTN